jgi:hypothetical protein
MCTPLHYGHASRAGVSCPKSVPEEDGAAGQARQDLDRSYVIQLMRVPTVTWADDG